MEDEVRVMETAFEEAFETLANGEEKDTLVQSTTDKLPVEIPSDKSEMGSLEVAFWDAVSMVNTTISTLRLRTVQNTSEEQEDVLRNLYRFVSGQLREVMVHISNGDIESQIMKERVESQQESLKWMLHDAGLLERAYNQQT